MTRASGRHRPHRGNPDPFVPGDVRSIIFGDTGETAPADTQRVTHNYEAITEPADIPGGKPHLVNPPAYVNRDNRRAAVDRRKPVDYHREHDVPPEDAATDYDVPRNLVHADFGESGEQAREAHIREAVEPDAVPVYIVEKGGDEKKIRVLAAFNIDVVPWGGGSGQAATRICSRDPNRVEIRILNEDSNIDIRFSSDLEELSSNTADVQGTGAGGSGALLWHGTNSYTDLKTQDEIWAVTTSTSASARMSVIIITEAYAV